MELILTRSMQEAALQCRQKENTFFLFFSPMHLHRTVIFPSAEKEKTPRYHFPADSFAPRAAADSAEAAAPTAAGLIREKVQSEGSTRGCSACRVLPAPFKALSWSALGAGSLTSRGPREFLLAVGSRDCLQAPVGFGPFNLC